MSQGRSNGDGNSKASRFIDEFPEFTNQIEFFIAEYKKLAETKATQLDEIDRLKSLVADKDNTIGIHEQRCLELRREVDALRMSLEKTKMENNAKVAELEKKLKAKEEEVGKTSNEVEGEANSMMNRMNAIKEKLRSLNLGGIDTDSLQMPKEQLTNTQESYERRSRSRERSRDSYPERCRDRSRSPE